MFNRKTNPYELSNLVQSFWRDLIALYDEQIEFRLLDSYGLGASKFQSTGQKLSDFVLKIFVCVVDINQSLLGELAL